MTTCKLIGEYTPMGPVPYSEIQGKVFEFQNYQNFLRVLNDNKEKDYFGYPYPGRLYGRRKNNDDSYADQQKALALLLKYPITASSVNEFEKGLKYFIKNHVLRKNRLYEALKTGYAGDGITKLYKDCVIVPNNNEMFGTYDDVLVRGEFDQFSPTINMAKIIKEAEVEFQHNLNTRGGSRKSRSKKNRKTRRR